MEEDTITLKAVMSAEEIEQLLDERDRAEKLLLHILPAPILEKLKQDYSVIAEYHADATVLFADLVDFTGLSKANPPQEVLALLNRIFSCFDGLAAARGLEKIKTIGDAYMAVGGVPFARPDHTEAVARLALDMQREIRNFRSPQGKTLTLRIGINCGPVVAGVIGTTRFLYDLWGDTVNVASRMESQGIPDFIQVTDAAHSVLKDRFQFEKRGVVHVKGRGEMTTWFLLSDQRPAEKTVREDTLTRVSRRIDIARREIRNLSLVDDLTGLSSRHGFLVLYEQLLHAAGRGHTRVLFLLLSVKNLTLVNDALGYQGGDRILKDIAAILLECFRTSDVTARVSGDAFLVAGMEVSEAPEGILTRRFKEKMRARYLSSGGPRPELELHEARWSPDAPKDLVEILKTMG